METRGGDDQRAIWNTRTTTKSITTDEINVIIKIGKKKEEPPTTNAGSKPVCK